MMNKKSAAAVATLSLLVFLASSRTTAASKSEDNRHRRRPLSRRTGGKKSEADVLRDERTRDLWQNPLWATPNTDLFWSAKEQPHHNDANWSAKKQGNPWDNGPRPAPKRRPPPTPPRSPSGPRPKGNPWDNPTPPAGAPARPRPGPRPQPRQPRPQPKGNPFDNPAKFAPSPPSPPSPSGAAGNVAPRPSPPAAASAPSASSLLSSAMAGGSPSTPSNGRTQPQASQQQVSQQQSSQRKEVAKATFTSTVSLRGVPATLPAFNSQRWTTLRKDLEARIESAINDSDQDVSVEKVTILSIGGRRVPRRLEGGAGGGHERDGNRSLQGLAQEVKYKAVLAYRCGRGQAGSSCKADARSSAEAIAYDLAYDLAPPPTKRPTRRPTVDNAGEAWVMLPGGLTEVQMIGESAGDVAVAPVRAGAQIVAQSAPADPTPGPTPPPTFPKFEGDASKRYCGYGWSDVVRSCLTATPCPQGYAKGVCPDGMICLADTPCANKAWLEQLEEMQSDEGAPDEARGDSRPAAPDEPRPRPSPGTTTVPAPSACANPGDCPRGQFCDAVGKYCVTCLPNGKGCSTDEVCATSPGGEPKCYDRPTPAGNANVQRGQPRREDPPAQPSQPAPAAAYRNPRNNEYFCGTSYQAIAGSCLQSKPCPTGMASTHCRSGEGCFYHPGCRAQYDAATYGKSTRMSFAAIDISVEMFSQEEIEALRAPPEDSTKEGGRENDNHWNDAGNIVLLNPATARQGSATFLCSAFALGGFFAM